jgi:hypothetical protein
MEDMAESKNYYELSQKDTILAVLACFIPSCALSIIFWFSVDMNGLSSNVAPLIFGKFLCLLTVLALVHMAMLMLFRKLIPQISGQVYIYSAVSGIAVAPAMALLSIDPFSISNYAFWQETGLILLLCIVAGWGVTVLPYLPIALWHDFQNSKNDSKQSSAKSTESDADNLRPAYVDHEFRFEYTYGVKYRLRDIPLIEVHHNKTHIGYLDPRWYKIYEHGAWDFGECWWRIILKKSDDLWVEISSRIRQTEGDDSGDFAPSMLESHVSGAVKRVFELKRNGFSFHRAKGELPEIEEKISCYDINITQIVPLYISLNELVSPVVKGVMNQQMELGIQLELAKVPDATHIIDVVDTFDYFHYYVAVRPEENHEEVVRKIEAKSMQTIHKIWKV